MRGPNIVLASTAYDRAVNGVEEQVFYRGEFCGWRTRYDNRLLMWLLRVRDPLAFAPLDDLQGWLRHRDLEPHAPIEPMLDRLAAAEEDWGRRLPGESAPARPITPAIAPQSNKAPVEWPVQRRLAAPVDTPSQESGPQAQ